MAVLDDELLQDATQDAETVAYIRTRLPQELQEKYSDDELYYFLDVLEELYADEDNLGGEADADGYVDIDLEAIAGKLARKAEKEGQGKYEAEDLYFVVEAHLDYILPEEDE